MGYVLNCMCFIFIAYIIKLTNGIVILLHQKSKLIVGKRILSQQ